MKTRLIMIAALAASQLPAAAVPAEAADLPSREADTQQPRLAEAVEFSLDGRPGAALADGAAPAPLHAAAAQEEEREPRKKKRKSTGDKVFTGAAVVLGIGALAVGGLLIAIFVG
ncbi:MAG TPA: hypothetical protein VF782_14995 [Allosphingosinicella sp.]|jgi:hypothetical protein